MLRHSDSVPPRRPTLPEGVRRVRERLEEDFAAATLVEWAERYPWLVQGTTTRRGPRDGGPFDLRLFPAAPGASDRWARLSAWAGVPSVVHASQVHEALVRRHEGPAEEGLVLAPSCDGHLTEIPGLLLTVSVADCVPVFIVDPERKRVAMVHAGWRGCAAGILEEGLTAVAGQGGTVASLRIHLGPSICGTCYEVGGEVFEAVGLPRPEAPTPIDLKAVLARRAVASGAVASNVTVSGHCTLCEAGGRFFSHRGGDAGRQVGFLGIRR